MQGGKKEGTYAPSAFRLAERKYKRYKNKKLSDAQDFTDVVDVADVEQNTAENRKRIRLLQHLVVGEADSRRSLPVYGIDGLDGLLVVPGVLTSTDQLQWAQWCLAECPLAPNQTNLGIMPKSIWKAHLQQQQPQQQRDEEGPSASGMGVLGSRGSSSREEPPAKQQKVGNLPLQATYLPETAAPPRLENLRWATLGYHYDWTGNVYREGGLWQSTFPPKLAGLMADLMPQLSPVPFLAEAAIINYYQADSMLKGHQDESEFTFDAPVVSLSIGNTAVFLMGGSSTDTPPTALYLRSGDLVIMGGKARVGFHGTYSPLPSTDSELRAVASYLRSTRININVRQVFAAGRYGQFLDDATRLEKLQLQAAS